MIEVSVKDTGVGIKDEDQAKLFKLFGFLDRTKEINTQGVGLGLHISKKIVQYFGGNIICKSIWGQGTTFTFLFALEERQILDQSVQRFKNPIMKLYPKIYVVKQN